MTINHLNLVLSDVVNGVSFFETYFGFSCVHIKGDYQIAVLKNAAGFTLVLMAQKDAPVVYPKSFHIGWMLDSAAAVDQLHLQLTAGGVSGVQSPRKIRDSYGFYFYFDALFIEIGYYLDAA